MPMREQLAQQSFQEFLDLLELVVEYQMLDSKSLTDGSIGMMSHL